MKNQESNMDHVQLPQPVRCIQVDGTGNTLHFFNHSDLLPEDMPKDYKPIGDWLVSMQSPATYYQMMHHYST